MSYNYAIFVTYLSTETVIASSDPSFQAILPDCIDYAEQRIYRELNLLDTVIRDSSAVLVANSRNFTLPQSIGRFVTVTGINIITPVGTTVSNGTRNQLQPIWRNLLDFLYPSEMAPASPSVPSQFAMITDQTVIVGAAPDQAYGVEVIGTIRPTPLSATNTATYLTNYLPDLFFAAAMIFMSGYMRNFGSQADDPKMAASWEDQYEKLFASANKEELRKQYNQEIDASTRP